MKFKFFLLLILTGSFTICGFTQALWMRYPAISPDGTTIVFSYKGNLFKVSASGGDAIPLTLHPAHDFRPVWSHDGEKIAFASNRYGNFDIFNISKHGGTPDRLTYFSGDEIPYSFAPDNQEVIYSTADLDHINNLQFPTGALPELYRTSLNGDRPSQILSTPALEVNLSRDGTKMLFEDAKGYEDPLRKHHTSSIARDVWLYDMINGSFSQLSTYEGEDRNPFFAPNDEDFYYLSARNGTINVMKSNLSNPTVITPMTSHEIHPVRHLTISDSGLLCYAFNGEIYTKSEEDSSQKVVINISLDHLSNPVNLKSVNSGISEMALSSNEKEIAIVHRGEVFVTSIDGSMTKRITNTPEQERMIDIAPDGKSILYASERNNSWNLYMTKLSRDGEKYFMNSTRLSEEPILESAAETFQAKFSPDGKEVAFIEDRVKLKVINLENQQVRTILDGTNTFSYADGDQHYDWSPDGKWFLVNFLPEEYWVDEVGLIKSDGSGEVINLTQSGFYDSNPTWTKKGEMMIWASDKHGLHGVAKTGPFQVDVFTMFFTKKAHEVFKLNKDEFKLYEEAEKEKKKKEDKDKKKEDEKENKDSTALKPITIELEGIQDRKERLTIHSVRLSSSVVTPDAKYLLYFARNDKGYDLWRTELRTKATKVLTPFGGGRGSLSLDKEGKNVFVLTGGKISKVEVESGKKTSVSVSGEMELNEDQERVYLFDHVTRQVQKKFYDPNLHGAQWEQLTKDYKRFLPHINNNHDFAEMLSELLGELNASHTGGRYRHNDPKGDQTASLGAFYDKSHAGNGLKILEILDGSPLKVTSGKIKVGVIIEQIDGVPISPDMNYYPLLNRKVGKVVLLSLFDDSTNERWEEKIKPVSQGAENQMLYERWIKKNREIVHAASNGRIGYMHIRGMSDGNFREFLEDVMGEEVNREALIVDSRFNGGGDLVDDLTTFLSGEEYMTFQARDRKIGYESQRRWRKPSIVLVGESNYSDAHCFPAGYRDLNIGKIVGMPVPGTCTFVWWERLQNGVVFGIPNMAVLDRVGDPLENKQLVPDIQVFNQFDQIVKGNDQQLNAAVEELLQELGN